MLFSFLSQNYSLKKNTFFLSISILTTFIYGQEVKYPIKYTASHYGYQNLLKRAFFEGYQNELYIVGRTHLTSKEEIINWDDMLLLSPINLNGYFVNVNQDVYRGLSRSFIPSIGGIQYYKNGIEKSYMLRKSWLSQFPKLVEFIETQNSKFSPYRFTISNQNDFAIGYGEGAPEHMLFFPDFNKDNTQYVRLRSERKGLFQDLQISANGRFIILVFSYKTFLFEYRNKSLTEIAVIDRGINNEFNNLKRKEGSFTSISDKGDITYHYPGSSIIQTDGYSYFDSLQIDGYTQESFATVESSGDTIAVLIPKPNVDSAFLKIYCKNDGEIIREYEIACVEPEYIRFTPNGTVQFFDKNGWREIFFGEKKSKFLQRCRPLHANMEKGYYNELFLNEETGKLFNFEGKEILGDIKKITSANSYGDVIIDSRKGGSYLYNVDTQVKISPVHDSMWLAEFAKVIFFKKKEKTGYIFIDHLQKQYKERLTELPLSGTMDLRSNNRFFLTYQDGEKIGITNHSLERIAEFEADALILKTIRDNRVILVKQNTNYSIYDIESDKVLPYKYNYFEAIEDGFKGFFKVKSSMGTGVFSLMERNEFIPAIYDTLTYFRWGHAFLLAQKDEKIDFYQRGVPEIRFTAIGIDSLTHYYKYDSEVISFKKEGKGFYLLGIDVNKLENPPIYLGPFDKVKHISVEKRKKYSENLRVFAEIEVNGQKMMVLEDNSLVPK